MPLLQNASIARRFTHRAVNTVAASAFSLVATLLIADSPAAAKAAHADDAKKYASTYIKTKHGWGTKQYNCLVKVWEYESHWNYKASGASGKYLGIPQLNRGYIKGAGYSIASYKSSYKTQVQVGVKYIKARYGTPCGARAHIKKTGWY